MSSKKGNIYLVWNYKNWGGAQIYFLAIIKAALRDWNIEVWLPRGSSEQFITFLEELNVKYVFLEHFAVFEEVSGVSAKIKRQFLRIRSEIEIYFRLTQLDKRKSVVHLESAPWQSWILISLLSLKGYATFVTIHNFPAIQGLYRTIISKLRLGIVSRLRNFHVFTANKDTKNKFRGWFSDNFWKRIDVTYAGIDPIQVSQALTNLDVSAKRRVFGIPEETLSVLSVGQFVDRKGRWVLLDSIKQICNDHDNIRFFWLMPDLPNDSDRKRIDSYELKDKFTTVLSSDVGGKRVDILQFIKTADIFVLPSYLEGLPISLLEAMALGVPCISTRINAIPEALIDEDTGLLISPGSSVQLTDAIIRLVHNEELRLKIGEQSRMKVLAEFDERKASMIVLGRYADAIKKDG